MAQHVILNHPDVADARRPDRNTDWSPRAKLACFLICAAGSWAIVLAPFFLFA